jgi:hypothetical protein
VGINVFLASSPCGDFVSALQRARATLCEGIPGGAAPQQTTSAK